MVETVTPSRHVLTHAFLRKAMVEMGCAGVPPWASYCLHSRWTVGADGQSDRAGTHRPSAKHSSTRVSPRRTVTADSGPLAAGGSSRLGFLCLMEFAGGKEQSPVFLRLRE